MEQNEGKKVCSKCGEEKELTTFVKNKTALSGYAGWCKPCDNKERSLEAKEKRGQHYCANCNIEILRYKSKFCPPCTKIKKEESIGKLCTCGVKIPKRSLKCKSCKAKDKIKFCEDCKDVVVEKNIKYCVPCGKIRRKNIANDWHHRNYKPIPKPPKKVKEPKLVKPIPTSKICTECKIEKLAEFMVKSKKSKGGFMSWCKSCSNAYTLAKYHAKQKKKFCGDCQIELSNKKKTYCEDCALERSRAVSRKHAKAHYHANLEASRQASKSYRINNREKYLETKRKYKKKYQKRDHKKKWQNIEYRLHSNVGRIIRFYILHNNGKKKGSILQYLPYSFHQLRQHIESQFEPWMSWNNWGKYEPKSWIDEDQSTWRWQLDHIIPQSDLPYDSMDHPNFLKCWNLNNLRPYSAKLNILDGIYRVRHKKK